MDEKDFMRLAIGKAKEGISKGQMPFGACIARDGEVVSCTYNTIREDMTITAHAETNAIKDASSRLGTIDLSGCTLYSTCEPCPMCFGACSLANISKVVYGARLEDRHLCSFRVLNLTSKEMNWLGGGKMKIVGDFLRDESLKLFKMWYERGVRAEEENISCCNV